MLVESWEVLVSINMCFELWHRCTCIDVACSASQHATRAQVPNSMGWTRGSNYNRISL